MQHQRTTPCPHPSGGGPEVTRQQKDRKQNRNRKSNPVMKRKSGRGGRVNVGGLGEE